jgi:hypothetical protein
LFKWLREDIKRNSRVHDVLRQRGIHPTLQYEEVAPGTWRKVWRIQCPFCGYVSGMEKSLPWGGDGTPDNIRVESALVTHMLRAHADILDARNAEPPSSDERRWLGAPEGSLVCPSCGTRNRRDRTRCFACSANLVAAGAGEPTAESTRREGGMTRQANSGASGPSVAPEKRVKRIFGDPADGICELLRGAGTAGMTRNEIRDAVGHRIAAARIPDALQLLASVGFAHMVKQTTGGRSAERWFYGPAPKTEAAQ